MRGVKAYQKTAITTSDPMDLLVRLYDGFLRHGHQAQELLGQGQRGPAGQALSKAIAIVNELQVSLQRATNEEFTDRLSAVYTFVIQELVQANLRGDPERLSDVIRIMSELRDAWAQAAAGLRSGRAQMVG